MENQNLPENVVWIKLSSDDLKITDELKELNQKVSHENDSDIVLDFSFVEIISSSNISNLLLLRGFLENHERKLILYNMQTITKCIFIVAGLIELFVFIDDIEEALRVVQSTT